MNPTVQRALLLYHTSRYDMAERELRMALAEEPHNAYAHAVLGLCLAEQKKYEDATRQVEHAIHLAPDEGFMHYALASVLRDRNRLAEAASAINEALRLEPHSANYLAALAAIRFAQERWSDALQAAEQGLQFVPDDDDCTNLRAMSLVKLGRRSEAGEAIQGALERAPENPLTHANQGWTYLEKGDPHKALEHFREALRLDPTSQWAKAGMLEALKARYLVYRMVLAFFLWMNRLPAGARWGVLIGGYLGYRFILEAARTNPGLWPLLLPPIILYIVFVLLTWIASPLMNLVLSFNQFGRHLLSPGERWTSVFVGALVAGAIACLAASAILRTTFFLWPALALALCIPAIAAVHACDWGWPRIAMILIALTVCGLGLFTVLPEILLLAGQRQTANALAPAAAQAIWYFTLASLASQFAASALPRATVSN
jgi:Flp pilus assembly protein TadD